MPEKLSDQLFTVPVESWDKGVALMNRLYELAEPGAVFSEPSEHHGHTIITASEVSVGLGFGHGFGGSAPGKGDEAAASAGEGAGGGGGGGGATSNRPVAVISISAAGVRVEPIIDITKIAIAAATALGAMGVMLSRMKKLAG